MFKNLPRKTMSIYFMLLIFNFIVLLSFLIVNLIIENNNINNFSVLFRMISLMFSVWAIINFILWYKIVKTFLHPYLVFFNAILLFNSGHLFLYNIDSATFPIMSGVLSDNIKIKTVLYLINSIVIFNIGTLIVYIIEKWNFKKIMECVTEKRDNVNHDKTKKIQLYLNQVNIDETILAVGVFLFIISVVPTVIYFKEKVSTVTTNGYLYLFRLDKETGVYGYQRILKDFFVPALYFIIGGTRKM